MALQKRSRYDENKVRTFFFKTNIASKDTILYAHLCGNLCQSNILLYFQLGLLQGQVLGPVVDTELLLSFFKKAIILRKKSCDIFLDKERCNINKNLTVQLSGVQFIRQI